MDKLSIILASIGIAVLIFSYWGFRLIQKHVKRFNNNHKFSQSLNDEKYFELKARQDYIIASSAIVFAVLSFIGYTSIKDIKNEMNEQMTVETSRLNKLNSSANETLTSFQGIELKGKDLQDSMRSAMELVSILKSRVTQIFEKDVIKQNIFIVDPFKISDFPLVKKKEPDGYREIKFKELITISGQKLPMFKVPPSIMCFSIDGTTVFITDVTTEGFKVSPQTFLSLVAEDSKTNVNPGTKKFSLWISQKSELRDFSSDFGSKDFK
jgi:hypothetical protein